ncbi:hypothetical protein NIES73_16080 [Sphaerospermopsis kisseleviana NIES-73]|nr:hypothetical protein NIES73_16080 [Sphaerospermopsis kisseleviana NIES-73]
MKTSTDIQRTLEMACVFLTDQFFLTLFIFSPLDIFLMFLNIC